MWLLFFVGIILIHLLRLFLQGWNRGIQTVYRGGRVKSMSREDNLIKIRLWRAHKMIVKCDCKAADMYMCFMIRWNAKGSSQMTRPDHNKCPCKCHQENRDAKTNQS